MDIIPKYCVMKFETIKMKNNVFILFLAISQVKNVLCILVEIQKGVQVRRELFCCSEN